jgi:hypothetical protein
VVAGGPRLGDLEAGAVATAFGDTASVVSGGLACIVGAFAVARALPGFTGLRWSPTDAAAESDDVGPGQSREPDEPGVAAPSDLASSD